jgi:molecular chaperone GrpE
MIYYLSEKMGELVEVKEKKRKKKTKKELQEELDNTKAERDKYKESLLRVTADFQNYKKKITAEKEEWQKFATQNLISELLEVLDNFELALIHESNHKDNPIWEGVKLINSKLREILNRYGLQRMNDTHGEKFDPNLHEALFYEEGESEENIILNQCRPGYFLHGKLLRPAGVVVSRKKSKEQPQ